MTWSATSRDCRICAWLVSASTSTRSRTSGLCRSASGRRKIFSRPSIKRRASDLYFGVMRLTAKSDNAAAIRPGMMTRHFLRHSDKPSARRSSSRSALCDDTTPRSPPARIRDSTTLVTRPGYGIYGFRPVNPGLCGRRQKRAGQVLLTIQGLNRLGFSLTGFVHPCAFRASPAGARCGAIRERVHAPCGLLRAAAGSDRRSLCRGGAPVAQPYMLDTGDRLRVSVFGQEGVTNTYIVDAGGLREYRADRSGRGARSHTASDLRRRSARDCATASSASRMSASRSRRTGRSTFSVR